MPRRPRIFLLALLLMLAAAVAPTTAFAADCTVTPSATVTTWAQYQAAITGVTCSTGNTFTINVTADLTLTSGTGITWTQNGTLLIAGDTALRRTVNMNGGDTYFVRSNSGTGPITLRNLVITGINATSDAWGAAISTYMSSALYTIDNTKIYNNTTLNPAIVAGSSASLAVINGSEISGNTSNGSSRSARGGAIYAASGLTITGSTITNNTGTGTGVLGGGAAYVQSGNVTVADSTISGNSIIGDGGGLYVNGGTLTMSGSTVSGNSATSFGGGLYVGGATTITNSTISGNATSGSGSGGIHAGSGLTMYYTTISGNTSTSGPASINTNANGVTATASVIASASATACTINGTKTAGYSISTSANCLPATLGTNQINTVAQINLGSLATNGGMTQTMLPGTGSALSGFINVTNPAPSVTTDQRGLTRIQPFTVGAVQIASTNADLSALTATGAATIALSPTFAAGTTSYAGSVANAVTSATITPTTAQSVAAVTVNGVATSSGSPSAAVSLTVGANAIPVVVTAQDGTTTKTYTVTITRAASTDATLSNLVISGGGSPVSLTPSFASGTYSYTANVANAITSVTATPTRSQANATITINGTAVASGTASGAIGLNVGTTTITAVVTAQDGTTTQSYTVTVMRAGSADATLSGLELFSAGSPITLTPSFASATTTYGADVANGISTASITPTATQANATITVNGTTVASGSASGAIALAVGSNSITIVVTAQDGSTTKTYDIAITRAATPPASDTAPPTIANVTPGNGRMTIAWVVGPNDPPATYTVVATPGGRKCIARTPTTSCTITGLTNGVAYTFTITATTATGATATSKTSGAQRPEPQAKGALHVLHTKVEGYAIITTVRVTRGGSLVATSTVPAGTLRASSTQRLCTVSKTVAKAGTYDLYCLLSPPARRTLAWRPFTATSTVTLTAGDRSTAAHRTTVLLAVYNPNGTSVTG